MKIIKSENELINYCGKVNITTSFVPTMGSLQEGHVKLFKKAKQYGDFLITSLFVNPLQFNKTADLLSYPKNIEKDISIFEQNNVDLLYIPDEKEIINSKIKNIDSGQHGKILEGKFRPGHFNGVLTIVNKFFELIKPNYAIFGIKDIQQLCLIFSKLSPLHDIKIIPVDTVRDANGLALSSRNNLLTTSQKQIASFIFKGLNCLDQELKQNKSVNILNFLTDFYNKIKLIDVEYILSEELSVFNEKGINVNDLFGGRNSKAIMVAVTIGGVRLIDNLVIN